MKLLTNNLIDFNEKKEEKSFESFLNDFRHKVLSEEKDEVDTTADDISVCLRDNILFVEDGEYDVFYEHCGDSATSKTKVRVASGMMRLKDLKEATAEVLRETRYWGIFLEEATFNRELNAIEIGVGS